MKTVIKLYLFVNFAYKLTVLSAYFQDCDIIFQFLYHG